MMALPLALIIIIFVSAVIVLLLNTLLRKKSTLQIGLLGIEMGIFGLFLTSQFQLNSWLGMAGIILLVAGFILVTIAVARKS
ncbi:hypothetical protein [Paenibacillus xylanexedens]|nr:hypothetical protein [Paenibacillus xylanexedens]